MAETEDFEELLRRVRAGDEQAAAELVRRYEPAIRRTIRLRMRDPHLPRALDSMDVCQSVLCSFFVRAALGHYDLDTPEDLARLLAVMARNKLAAQARRPQVRRREEVAEGPSGAWDPPGHDASPSRQVAARD